MSFFDTHLSGCSPRSDCLKCILLAQIKAKFPIAGDEESFIFLLEKTIRAERLEYEASQNKSEQTENTSIQNTQLNLKIIELELSIAATFRLRDEGIHKLGDLVAMSENELLRDKRFSKRIVNEIKKALAARNLGLYEPLNEIGMTPP